MSSRFSQVRGVQAEDWQLQILSEVQQKQPTPNAEQKKLLAVQTGLDAKWITGWFKRANAASKKTEKLRSNDTALKSRTDPTMTYAVTSGNSTGFTGPADRGASAVEPSFLSSRSSTSPGTARPAGILARPRVSQCGTPGSQAEYGYAASYSQAAEHPTPVSRLLPAPFQSHGTANASGAAHALASSFQHASFLSGIHAHPLGQAHTSLRPLEARSSRKALVPPYAGHLEQSEVSETASACSTDSIPPPLALQLPFGHLPTMYSLLFGADDGLGSTQFQPEGSAAVPHPKATPISFVARWEDMLALERRIRSTFNAHVQQLERASQSDTASPESLEEHAHAEAAAALPRDSGARGARRLHSVA
ncbi:hypothetical protein BC834DRAFT_571968 [Gloeopeniophorella convolvens]|nr:hypothetical protein BC834DRAFT_571968 [Gloeopeniophorella convolvens]